MSAAFVLEAEGLRKSFGGLQAVQGMSFTVAPAELVALIGPNGAGKSTCFNMLMGQLAADAGTVRILGEDVTGWPPMSEAGRASASSACRCQTTSSPRFWRSQTLRQTGSTTSLERSGFTSVDSITRT